MKSIIKLQTLTVAILTATVLALPVAADEVADLDTSIQTIDKHVEKGRPQDVALKDVSRQTGVSEKELRKQQEKTKLGTGSLFVANVLAKETGKTFDEIVALKSDGKGWGKIAKENGVKLGPIVSKARKLEKEHAKKPKGGAVEQPARDEAGKKADKAGSSEKNESPKQDKAAKGKK